MDRYLKTSDSDWYKQRLSGIMSCVVAAFIVLAARLFYLQVVEGAELRRLSEIRQALEAVGVSDRSTVVVYGSNPMVAARLWMTLDVTGAGASDPLFLDGGIQLWKEEGRPLTSETPRFSRGRLTVRPASDRLVSADWILVRLGHDGLSLVDARPEDEFSGANGGMGGRFEVRSLLHDTWRW